MADRQLPPRSNGFGMGLFSINLVESVRKLGPVVGVEPAQIATDPANGGAADAPPDRGKPSS